MIRAYKGELCMKTSNNDEDKGVLIYLNTISVHRYNESGDKNESEYNY